MDLLSTIKTRLKEPRSEDIFCALLATYDRCSKLNLIAEFLGLTKIEQSPPGEYTRDCVLVESITNALQFALQRGFSQIEIYHFTRLFLDMLTSLISKTGYVTLRSTVEQLQMLTSMSSVQISYGNLLVAVHYITTTILSHFHLYEYLLNEEQITDMTILRPEVHTPPAVLGLDMSISEKEWQLKEKVKLLEMAHAKRKDSILQAKEKALRDGEVQEAGNKCNGAQVGNIVDELLRHHAHRVQAIINQDLASQEADMQFHIERLELLLSESDSLLQAVTPMAANTPRSQPSSRAASRK